MKRLRYFTQAADTAPALEALRQMGVIEQQLGFVGGKVTRNYSPGHFPQSFRLRSPYQGQPVVSRTLHNVTLSRKVRKVQETENARAAANHPGRMAVLANLNAVTVSPAGKHFAAQRTFSSDDERTAWHLSLSELEEGAVWMTAGEKSERIFHNVCQTPSELRRHLLIDGENTTEVDIAGAQLFFLLSLYRAADAPEAERKRFADAVVLGDIYEAIFKGCANRRQWGGDEVSWRATFRGAFKERVFSKVLYSRSDWGKPADVNDSFAGLFPWLAGHLALLRVGNGAAQLACEMQRQESSLILGHVIPRIIARLPGCKPISLHDGILCQRRFAEDVKRVVEEEAERLYGVRPLVRTK